MIIFGLEFISSSTNKDYVHEFWRYNKLGRKYMIFRKFAISQYKTYIVNIFFTMYIPHLMRNIFS